MRILVALLVSIALHLIAFLYFQYSKQNIFQSEPQKKSSTTKVRYVKLQQPKTPINEQPKQTPIVSEKPKKIEPPKDLPKIVELPPIIKEEPKQILPPKIEPTKSKIIEEKKVEIPKTDHLPKTPQQPNENLDQITKSYLELYKDDFDSFAPETKVFLVKNLKDIGRITQRFLIYPLLSIQARQSGINVVEFTLNPNGKITEPKIIKSSKYYILDDNSVETINQAYRDYPRPTKPTIIRIYVKYELI